MSMAATPLWNGIEGPPNLLPLQREWCPILTVSHFFRYKMVTSFYTQRTYLIGLLLIERSVFWLFFFGHAKRRWNPHETWESNAEMEINTGHSKRGMVDLGRQTTLSNVKDFPTKCVGILNCTLLGKCQTCPLGKQVIVQWWNERVYWLLVWVQRWVDWCYKEMSGPKPKVATPKLAVDPSKWLVKQAHRHINPVLSVKLN